MDQLPDMKFYAQRTKPRIDDAPHADVHDQHMMRQVRFNRLDLRPKLNSINGL